MNQALTIDSGDTAWVLVATALVMLMVLPGLALFYGGPVRAKNLLSVMSQVLGITALASAKGSTSATMASVRIITKGRASAGTKKLRKSGAASRTSWAPDRVSGATKNPALGGVVCGCGGRI